MFIKLKDTKEEDRKSTIYQLKKTSKTICFILFLLLVFASGPTVVQAGLELTVWIRMASNTVLPASAS
jgi:energy-coupling factor transporter transmembrane protein EcfT